MIGSTRSLHVWAYPAPTDLRKGIDGLCGLVTQLHQDPLAGDCFLFVNRLRTRAKVRSGEGRRVDASGGWLVGEGQYPHCPRFCEAAPRVKAVELVTFLDRGMELRRAGRDAARLRGPYVT